MTMGDVRKKEKTLRNVHITFNLRIIIYTSNNKSIDLSFDLLNMVFSEIY